MVIRLIFSLFVIFFLSCSLENCTEPQIQILQNDETFDKLLFFQIETEPKDQVIGIDPDTYEIKVRISGGSEWHICYPTTSSDGRLFINPALLKRAAPADDKIVVLNKYGKPIKTMIPEKGVQVAKMFIVDDYLFIGDPGGAVCMIDTRNYYMYFYDIFFDRGGDMLHYNPRLRWKNYVFLAGGGNRLLKINLKNPDEREVKTNYAPYEFGFYHFCVYDDRIVSLDLGLSYTNKRDSEVRVYNLNNDSLITNFFISNYITAPKDREYYYVQPVVIGNELLIYVKEDPGSKYARMLVFDKDNYSFKEEINLDNNMFLFCPALEHVRGTKFYFNVGYAIYIYDHSQKKCVKIITVEDVMARR